MQSYRRRASVRRLSRCNLSIFEHGINHQVAALDGPVGMVDGRINLRPFRQTSQQRGFGQGKLSSRLAEVVFRCRLKPVYAMPQKNLIGVEREDLWFGEATLDLNRQHHFLHLAMER